MQRKKSQRRRAIKEDPSSLPRKQKSIGKRANDSSDEHGHISFECPKKTQGNESFEDTRGGRYYYMQ